MTQSRDSLGEVEHLLMVAVLRLGEGAYGVTIHREVESRAEREIALGAIYTALDRLEQKGFVRSALSAPTAERGGRSKRTYSLQARGLTALRQSRERLLRMWDGLPADLLRTVR